MKQETHCLLLVCGFERITLYKY